MSKPARITLVALTCAGLLVGAPGQASIGAAPRVAAADRGFTPGAAGAGDAYYPLDGNGGYNVGHYSLDFSYRPASDRLAGKARISAVATKDLSSFHLDFDGMTVHSVRVNLRAARWRRDHGELIIDPRHGLREGRRFVTVVRYSGVPQRGFLHTDGGAVVVGQPHVATHWFPANDHPTDKASYTFWVSVPQGLRVVANGVLRDRREQGDRTTWVWNAREPMASYLATVAIGDFQVRTYRKRGVRFWDAIDAALLEPFKPRSGSRFAISRKADSSYKRLSRTITVPAGGAELSFWVDRHTESGWDHVLVEAHTAGRNDWTTLPDQNGHTRRRPGFGCPRWLDLHPFLRHYQSASAGSCTPRGTTGRWRAASGESDGWEKWTVDLSRFAASEAVVSISTVSDESIQAPGVVVDDIAVSTGDGTTSFENDGNPRDGWRVLGAPRSSPGNSNDWILGTAEAAPPSIGELARRSLSRQGEVMRFLSARLGPYPFSAAGGIVVDRGLPLGWARQTRPMYPGDIFTDPANGTSWVAHELSHQWLGNSLTVRRWRHIWLNEGFASYLQWLWNAHHGGISAQQEFDFWYGTFGVNDPFWDFRIGDPGADRLLDFSIIFARGPMTLHALRLTIGNRDFFRILHRWAQGRAGDHVTTPQFVRLAEQVAGRQLDRFFHRWLFSPDKPPRPPGMITLDAGLAPEQAPLLAKWWAAER